MGQSVAGVNTRLWIQKEATYGVTPVSWLDAVKIHQKNFSAPVDKVFIEENSNLGKNFSGESYATGIKISGSAGITLHPEQLGAFLFYTMGDSSALFPPVCRFLIVYTGTSASCILQKKLNILSAKKGSLLTEVLDPNFGGAGSGNLDLSGIATINDLITAINTYTGYAAYLLYGTGTQAPTEISDFVYTQIKNLPYPGIVYDLSSAYVENKWKPSILQSSFAIFEDKVLEKYIYTGCKINDFTLNIEPRSPITGSISLIIQNATRTTAAMSKPEEQTRVFLANLVKVFINGVQTNEVKKVSIKYSNNMSADENILGSVYIAEPTQKQSSMALDLEFRYVTDTISIYDNYIGEDDLSIQLYCEGYDEFEPGQKYYFLIYLTKAKIISASAPISGADNITLPVSIKVGLPFEEFYNTWDEIPVRVWTTTKINEY